MLDFLFYLLLNRYVKKNPIPKSWENSPNSGKVIIERDENSSYNKERMRRYKEINIKREEWIKKLLSDNFIEW